MKQSLTVSIQQFAEMLKWDQFHTHEYDHENGDRHLVGYLIMRSGNIEVRLAGEKTDDAPNPA